MNKHNQISITERKKIQLNMLKEIDAFCRANSIKYSLAFGTLLGAIRHQGFIPWDDDVDIIMPLPDMLRFKELIKSTNLQYVDIETNKNHYFTFSRIAHLGSYSKMGIRVTSYGINIDLYPVVSIPKDEEECSLFFSKAQKLERIYIFLRTWNRRIISRFPFKRIAFINSVVRKYRNLVLFTTPYGSSGVYYIVGGPISHQKQDSFDIDLFDKMQSVNFENEQFMATAYYDRYLTQAYGDYMTPPPVELQIPTHGGKYYWK